MFLKKSKDILDMKTSKQKYLEYKQTIQQCVDTFVLDSLILFAGIGLIDFTSLFSPYNFKKNDELILDYF